MSDPSTTHLGIHNSRRTMDNYTTVITGMVNTNARPPQEMRAIVQITDDYCRVQDNLARDGSSYNDRIFYQFALERLLNDLQQLRQVMERNDGQESEGKAEEE